MVMSLAVLAAVSAGTYLGVHLLKRRRGLNALALLLATVAGAGVFYWTAVLPARSATQVSTGIVTMLGVMYSFMAALLVNVVFIAWEARKK